MKTVILCGGKGTRLEGQGESVPKPLVEIGGRPILWHVMRIYAAQGFRQFVLCLGHRGEAIRDYFRSAPPEDWDVELADTGPDTQTGGRIWRIAPRIGGEESFMVTYADGVAAIDLGALLAFHRAHGRTGTVTAVRPTLPWGLLEVREDGRVARFGEKPVLEEWVNGGFFVFRPALFDYLGPDDVLEQAPLERLAKDEQLMAFRHTGFWACLDTYKDTVRLNRLWAEGRAPWRTR